VNLGAPMRDADLRIELAGADHREALRTVCAEDEAIWEIYPIRYHGEDFDRNFDGLFTDPRNIPFILFDGGRLVGMTSYISVDPANRNLDIGRTYISPLVRGTGFNRRVKTLMLDRAFAAGFVRVGFRVDTRNARSMAAVLKLGAVQEGILRKERITWTGYVRDTAIFSIIAEDWVEREA
jgi:RimJ/RimL family protein N-acetyltransferase